MRRLATMLLAALSLAALAGCAPSPEERRESLQESIATVDGVTYADVAGSGIRVSAEEGVSAEDATEILDEVRALVIEDDPEDVPTVDVWFTGPEDRAWIGSWAFGAIAQEGFDQQAQFVASLSEWAGINAADAPFSKIRLEVSDPTTDRFPDQFVSIQAYEMSGPPSEQDRAELLDLWVKSGGDPDVYIHWRDRS